MIPDPRPSAAHRGGAIRELGASLPMAVLYGWFAYAHVVALADSHRISHGLAIVVDTLFAVLFLTRRRAEANSGGAWDWLTMVGGTFTPLLLRPSGVADATTGEIVQVFGAAATVLAALSLNRSIGLLPANRGIKRGGMYRFVRHPLYSAYVISNCGYVISNLSTANTAIALMATAFQVLRIVNEERFLSQFAEYRDYMNATRWRVLPFVF